MVYIKPTKNSLTRMGALVHPLTLRPNKAEMRERKLEELGL